MEASRVRRRFSIPFKLRAIDQYGKDGSYGRTARRYKETRKTIKSWVRNREALMMSVRNRNRYRIAPLSRCFHPELEFELHAEIIEMRHKGVCVSGPCIIARARAIHARLLLEASSQDQYVPAFRGTNCWLSGFLKRMLIYVITIPIYLYKYCKIVQGWFILISACCLFFSTSRSPLRITSYHI